MTENRTALPVTVIDGVHMLGGEMLNWSDQASLVGPFRSPLGADLTQVTRATAGRVLVLGPHSYELIQHLADRSEELHVLVRSWPDAAEVRDHVTSDRLAVFCGPLERFAADDREYDCIVALDGLRRVDGSDAAPLDWPEKVEALSGMLAERGEILLAVDNPLGLQHVVAASSAGRWGEDAEWTPGTERPRGMALGIDSIRRTCAQVGLSASATLAAFPNAHAPTLVLSDWVLDAHARDERLSTLVSQAFTHELELRTPLKDPRVLARTAAQSGLGLSLASAWVLHLTAPDAARPSDHEVPAVLFAETDEVDFWGVKYSVHPDADGTWRRRVLDTGDRAVRQVGELRRIVTRLDGAVPPGVILEEQMVASCADHDIPAIRQMVRDYVAWLRSHATEKTWVNPWTGEEHGERLVLDGDFVFATLENVVRSGADLEPVDASWTIEAAVPFEVAALRAFRTFAQRLVTGGYAHPWPFATSPDRIATSLAAMVGIVVTEEMRHHVAALAATVERPPSAWVGRGDEQAEVAAADAKARRPLGEAHFLGHDEALAAVERLTTQLAEAESQVEWLIKRIHLKENQLRKAQKATRKLSRSREYLLGAKIVRGQRKLALRRATDEAGEDTDAHLWRPPPPAAKGPRRNPKLLPPGLRPTNSARPPEAP